MGEKQYNRLQINSYDRFCVFPQHWSAFLFFQQKALCCIPLTTGRFFQDPSSGIRDEAGCNPVLNTLLHIFFVYLHMYLLYSFIYCIALHYIIYLCMYYICAAPKQRPLHLWGFDSWARGLSFSQKVPYLSLDGAAIQICNWIMGAGWTSCQAGLAARLVPKGR